MWKEGFRLSLDPCLCFSALSKAAKIGRNHFNFNGLPLVTNVISATQQSSAKMNGPMSTYGGGGSLGGGAEMGDAQTMAAVKSVCHSPFFASQNRARG